MNIETEMVKKSAATAVLNSVIKISRLKWWSYNQNLMTVFAQSIFSLKKNNNIISIKSGLEINA